MKKITILMLFGFLIQSILFAQSVTIGAKEFTAHPAAILEIQSTSKGILIPRVTYTQRMYIPNSATSVGLLIYQTDKESGFYYWDGVKWIFLAPSQSLELPNLSTVATSGSYDDLKDKPTIPTKLSELYQDEENKTITSAEKQKLNSLTNSNFSGSYNDLSDKPTYAQVATSGNYNDLGNKPKIPTRLQDLEQDENYYTTINRAEREKWNAAAAGATFTGSYKDLTDTPLIPTSLSDLSTDLYNQRVSQEDKAAWHAKSNFSGQYNDLLNKPTIPIMLRDLQTDYNNLTVSEAEKTRWNTYSAGSLFDGDYYSLTNRPLIPTKLSELEQNEYFRTVNDNQIAAWTAKSSFSGSYNDLQDKPTIPYFLRDLQTDYNNLTVSEAEKEKWNKSSQFSGQYKDLEGKPTIPTKLSDLESEPLNRTVTDAEKILWQSKSNFSGSYLDLSDRPNLSPISSTGSYTDLINKPVIPTHLSELLSSEQYRTVTDAEKIAWTAKSSFSGKYKDLEDKPTIPTKLSELEEDANSVHVKKADKDEWNKAASGDLTGTAHEFFLKENIYLNGIPKVPSYSTITNSQLINARESDASSDQIASMRTVYKMMVAYLNLMFPVGSVIMWEGTAANIPCGWELHTEIAGKFPVSMGQNIDKNKTVDNYTTIGVGTEDGFSRVTLDATQIPTHTHGGVPSYYAKVQTGSNTSNEYGAVRNGTTDGIPGTPGIDYGKPHENRPPYYALYFIKRTNDVCPK